MFACHREHTAALAAADRPEHPALIALREQLDPLRKQFRELLEQGANATHPKTARFCAGILEEYEALWTFCDVPGVTMTNNDAKRALLRRATNGTVVTRL